MSERATAPESVRCPNCGAFNRTGSQWCGQCHTRLDAPGPTPPTLGESPPSRSPSPADGGNGAFRVDGGVVLWACPRCATENPLTQDECSACGAAFVEMVRPPEPPRKERDPGTAALVSLFWPGAGHAWLGRWADAITRSVLTAWVLLVIVVTALQEGPGSGAVLTVFAVAAAGLWAVTAHDAYRTARGEDAFVLLKGKMVLYVVLGLLLVLMGLLTVAGFSAQSA